MGRRYLCYDDSIRGTGLASLMLCRLLITGSLWVEGDGSKLSSRLAMRGVWE